MFRRNVSTLLNFSFQFLDHKEGEHPNASKLPTPPTASLTEWKSGATQSAPAYAGYISSACTDSVCVAALFAGGR